MIRLSSVRIYVWVFILISSLFLMYLFFSDVEKSASIFSTAQIKSPTVKFSQKTASHESESRRRRALLIYPNESDWEFDFIRNDIFSEFNIYKTLSYRINNNNNFQFENPDLLDQVVLKSAIDEEEKIIEKKKMQNPICNSPREFEPANDDVTDKTKIHLYSSRKGFSVQVKEKKKFPVRILVVPTTPQVRNFVSIHTMMDKTKPHICVSTGDENPGAAIKQLKVLLQHPDVWNEFPFRPRTCHLILKQYGLSSTSSLLQAKNNNAVPSSAVIRIPLGYKTGMFSEGGESHKFESSSPSSDRRPLKWSFFGSLHRGNEHHEESTKDRQEMISVFRQWLPFETSSTAPIRDVRNFYKKSKFVPIGRGFFGLECFRIYEAVMNGAIPIVVGSSVEEIQRTFSASTAVVGFGDANESLGWVLATSWKDALEKAQTLEKNSVSLIEAQATSMRWLERIMKRIRKRVRDEVEENVDVVKCW